MAAKLSKGFSPKVKLSVDELILSSPPEKRSRTRIDSDLSFLDFVETENIPKNFQEIYGEVLGDVERELAKKMRSIRPQGKHTEKVSVPYGGQAGQDLDLDSTLEAKSQGNDRVFAHDKRLKKKNLNFLVDHSASIKFSTRLIFAEVIGRLVVSRPEVATFTVLLFAESVKEFQFKSSELPAFFRQYLGLRTSGYTNLSKAIQALNDLPRSRFPSTSLIMSDGISSVGKAQFQLELDPNQIHYLRIGANAAHSKIEQSLIEQVGVFIDGHDQSISDVLLKLYQIIKRLN